MAEKKSDWQIERERRRKDLLELKSEDKPAEPQRVEERVPLTFREKAENFWYHNKWIAIGAAALCLVAVICVVQIITRPKYDCQVVVYMDNFMDKASSEALQAQLEKYCPDTNGDGEVNVLIVDCCVYKNMSTSQMKDVLDRVQAQLMDPSSVLFIVDDETITQLDEIAPEIFVNKQLPSLAGRGVNLAGSSIDEAVQKADTADTIKGNYYIAVRNFSESSAVHPKEEQMAAANALVENINAEVSK